MPLVANLHRRVSALSTQHSFATAPSPRYGRITPHRRTPPLTARIPDSHKDILLGKNFAHVATLMPGGGPQVTPVWVDFDGECVVFNTAEGRQKTRNLDRDPRVAISVHDQERPYRYLQVRGRVIERTTQGAEDHIDKMAKKYMGADTYPDHSPLRPRVIYRVRPDHVQTMG